eukprot:TRINITY_DN18825_c0_g2_i2.p1 TRINITY_DN18825_c0_g2~~TRINITY_DN18825_c0_g2_i2.p1  ORF type:complete len:620 (-),score=110.51 TRINITY_DN18825_c0_g2_i2:13-1872(-)
MFSPARMEDGAARHASVETPGSSYPPPAGQNWYNDDKNKFDGEGSLRGGNEFGKTTKQADELRLQVKAVIDGTKSLQKPTFLRNIFIAYLMSVIVVILLSLAGQLVVQYAITRSYSDANVVNISGRQRMFSQMITKDVLTMVYALDHGNNVSAYFVSELSDKITLWKKCQLGLRYGSSDLDLPKATGQKVLAHFDAIQGNFEAMFAAGSTVLNLNPLIITKGSSSYVVLLEQATIMLANEGVFWNTMNTVTNEFAASSKSHLEFVLTLSWVFHALLILTLILEGLFIIRPVLTKMKQLVDSRFGNIRDTLQGEAENSWVSFIMMAYIRNEMNTPLGCLLDCVKQVSTIVKPHVKTDIPRRATGSAVEVDEWADALRDLNRSLLCIGLMQTIVSDVTNMANLETAKMTLAVEPVNILPMLREVIAMMRSLIPEGVSMAVDVSNEVQRNPVWVLDKQRLLQALVNMLKNALSWTTEGSVTLRVRLLNKEAGPDGEGAGEQLHVEVGDTGRGLSEDEQTNAFQPGTEEGGEGQVDRGSGLSLYVVKMLVELQGGTVGLESEEGQGTVVWFDIPAPRAAEGAAVTGGSMPRLQSMTPSGQAAFGGSGAGSGQMDDSTQRLLPP